RGPAVANSDYVQGDRTRLIRTVLEGLREPVYVNGVRWKTGEMLGWGDVWDDFRIAAVLTYIRATLNDSTVVSCIPEDFETITWSSRTLAPRPAADGAGDTISVEAVRAVGSVRQRYPACDPAVGDKAVPVGATGPPASVRLLRFLR